MRSHEKRPARLYALTATSRTSLESWGGVAEASIDMPVRRTHVQLAASAILSAMKVGVVLSFPNDITVLGRANVQWEPWRTDGTAVAAGPISAAEYSTIPVAFKANANALPGSVTVYLGANRGRGQAYPNGAVSNLVSSRWSATGVVPGRSFIAKRLGIACWVWATAWRQPFQLVGPGHSILRVAGLRSFSVPGWCFGCRDERWRLWPNRGAAGRPERNQGVCRLCRESDSPDALYGRQKQYERWKTPLESLLWRWLV